MKNTLVIRLVLGWICATVCFSVAGILAYSEVDYWGWFVFTGLVSIPATTEIKMGFKGDQ